MYDQCEHDRKVRREIANSNERRRMQSINDGFKALKGILPHPVGDKLSKAAILQQTADYIYQLDNEKTRLLSLNEKYRSLLSDCSCGGPKRREFINDLFDKDEGIGSPREEDLENLRRDSVELRHQLDKERKLRLRLEEKLDSQTKLLKLHGNCESSSCQLSTTMDSKVVKPLHNDQLPLPSMDTIRLNYSQANILPSTTLPTEIMPNAALCVAVGQDCPIQFPPVQVKCSDNLPRSSQPLKKRSIEVVFDGNSLSPQCKVPKIQAITILSSAVVGTTQTRSTIVSPPSTKTTVFVQKAPVCAVSNMMQANRAEALSTTNGAAVQARLVQPSMNSMTIGRSLLTTNPATQGCITLTPADSQTKSSAVPIPSAFVSATAFPTQPVQEEMTLNQLNSVPPASMTLTQLNALPGMVRFNSAASVATTVRPPAQVQTQYLPVVAMDAVLNKRGEQAMISTNSVAVSGNPAREAIDDRVQPDHTKDSICKGSHSDPIQEAPEREAATLVELNTVKSTPALHQFPDCPGSPSYAVATRSNLETIVQAIDHLEQQERRYSQDQQTIDER